MDPGKMVQFNRGGFLLSLFLAAVTGFNAILLYHHGMLRHTGWFFLILLGGILLPGAIPFSSMVESLRAGELHRRWREGVAFLIGAADSFAVLARWPEGLEDLSWVSLYIIFSTMAFLGLARSG
jgi:hypothetical protein